MAWATRSEQVRSLVGTTLASRYGIESVLGEGGMGAVFRARRVDDGAWVALKVVWQEGSTSLLPRFLREARLSSQVRHPHVVQVLDFGRWGEGRDRYFLVTELVEGVTLEVLMGQRWLSGEAVEMACQVLDALAHLHARGILHRDVKPENVLVQRLGDGRLFARVTDFGIAAAMDAVESERLTREGESLGTPLYMAPEQGMGEVLTGPTLDLYPVGVMLFRMLTGRFPFEGRALEVMVSKATREASWPEDAPPVPEPVRTVVMRLLARQPEARFQVAADVTTVLTPWREAALWHEARWLTQTGLEPGVVAGLATLSAPSVTRAAEEDGADIGETLVRTPGVQAGLLGREAELRALYGIAAEVEGGQARAVLVTGGVGVGKTALARQLVWELAEAGRFQAMFALHLRGAAAFEGLRGALDHLMGTTGRGPAVVEEAARELLRRQGEPDEGEVAELVAFMRPSLGGVVAADREGRYGSLIVRMLRRLARSRPVALVLDDIDAGGAVLAGFVEYALFEASLDPAPLLLLLTLTPGSGDAAFEAALGRSARFEGTLRRTIKLGPLGIETLASALEAQGLERGAAQRIARRARGNPLFAEHLARAGAAEETSTPSTSSVLTVQILDTSERHEVPASLRSILEASLAARLARTRRPEIAREWLLWGAVLGEEFDAALLEEVAAGATGVEALDADIDDLLDAGLLVEGRLSEGDRLAFPHALMRETLLSALTARRLRRCHRRAAEIREARAVEPVCIDAGRIGVHWSEAGEAEAAVRWWLRAMEWEMRAGEAAAAVAWGMRVLDNTPRHDPRWASTATRLGRVLLEIGDPGAAAALLEPVVEHTTADTALLAAEVLGEVYESHGAGRRWATLIARMEERLNEGSEVGRRAFWRARALLKNTRGDSVEGYLSGRLAWEGAPPGEERLRGAIRFAFAASLLGEKERAIALSEEALEHTEGRTDLRLRVLRSLGVFLTQAGRLDEARRAFDEVYELARRTGRVSRIPVYHVDMSSLHHLTGDFALAREQASEAIRAAEALNDRWSETFGHLQTALYDLIDRRLDGIQARIDALESAAMEAGLTALAGACTAMRAWALVLTGHEAEAFTLLQVFPDPERLPSVPLVAEFMDNLSRLFLAIEGPMVAQTRPWGIAWAKHAARCWRQCGVEARAAALDAVLQALDAGA